ncbi:NAD-dependent epimerase/dehydratase family protein [Phytoactinopolyspora limicola]|uniref:NAD-dependent epimerase/dehydratase family protein n=1 Tax=Phytoactinopolyspora limicola TaxID=2715536 RepID=UPI00140DD4CA|nr:NAD(P)-dependent oxidoreductase [Phytoactinopolyspora limicola]
MRILVTGVAGRVGSTLAQHLVQAGHDVRGVVRPRGRLPHESMMQHVGLVQADLSDTDALMRAVSGTDVVVHLAARMVMSDMPVEEFFDANVTGTLRVLEACVRQPTPPRRIVFASTDNVYGPAEPRSWPMTEEHPQVPGDYYGTSKVLGEELVRNYGKLHGLPYVIVRLASVLAPNETSSVCRLDWARSFVAAHVAANRRSNLWPLFADRLDVMSAMEAEAMGRRDNPAVALTGPDGEPWAIHFTDVRDAVTGLMLAISDDAAVNNTFNIAGPRTTTFEEASRALTQHLQLDSVTLRLPVRLAFELSIDKAGRLLGYSPEWTFGRSLASGIGLADAHEVHDYVPVGEV